MNSIYLTHLFVVTVIVFFVLFLFNKRIKRIFVKDDRGENQALSKEQFYERFEKHMVKFDEDQKNTRWKELLEKAWKVRDFEIELYWKRTNYFWLFQVPALAAFFLITKNETKVQPDEVFILCCLGVVFSLAWLLINKGSKQWQKHWEAYIDLFEDKYYGPLYKTVEVYKTYSVSKTNEIVSVSFLTVWILFGLKVFLDNSYSLAFYCDDGRFNPLVAFAIFFLILAVLSMTKGYGRGLLPGKKNVVFYEREVSYKSNDNPKL